MSRFHPKYHKKAHHTNSTVGYPDSASDPIASQQYPFQGDFYVDGGLSARGPLIAPYIVVSGTIITLNELLGLSALDIDLSDYTLTTDFLDLRNDHTNTKTIFASTSSTIFENISLLDSLLSSTIPNNPDITINGQNGVDGNYVFSLNQATPETINLSINVNTVAESSEIPSFLLGLDNESPTKNTRKFGLPYVLSGVEAEFASASASFQNSISNIQNKTDKIYNGLNTLSAEDIFTYVIQLSDSGKIVEMDSLSANTVLIPNNTMVDFPVPSFIDIVQLGVGLTSLSASDGVTLLGDIVSQGQYKALTMYQRAADIWVVVGGTV